MNTDQAMRIFVPILYVAVTVHEGQFDIWNVLVMLACGLVAIAGVFDVIRRRNHG